jgi:hypothetical protein
VQFAERKGPKIEHVSTKEGSTQANEEVQRAANNEAQKEVSTHKRRGYSNKYEAFVYMHAYETTKHVERQRDQAL